MPTPVDNLNPQSSSEQSNEAISQCIQIEMDNYHKTGMIGNAKPRNESHARQIAIASCSNQASRNSRPVG